MQALVDLFINQFLIFVFVLVRVTAGTITAPIVGTSDIPPQARVLFGVSLAILVAPAQFTAVPAVYDDLFVLALVVFKEVAIGMVLGIGVTILLSGVFLSGQIIAQMGGMALADVFNPSVESTTPLFSHLLHLVAMAIYVILGGHRLLIGGLLGTFETMPPGEAEIPASIVEVTITLLSASFDLGIRVAAPATVALLLATLILGLISRTLPQLNLLSFGFGANILVTLGALLFSFGALAWIIEDELETAVGWLVQMW